MKHRMNFRKLGRTSSHRMAMLRNMVTSLINHERIETTLPKAKELRRLADQVVGFAKKGDDRSKVLVRGIVREDPAVEKLFNVFGPRYQYRNGGYTRIVKTGFRYGDNAEMAVIEYIDRPGELKKPTPCPPPAELLKELSKEE